MMSEFERVEVYTKAKNFTKEQAVVVASALDHDVLIGELYRRMQKLDKVAELHELQTEAIYMGV